MPCHYQYSLANQWMRVFARNSALGKDEIRPDSLNSEMLCGACSLEVGESGK